MPRALAAGVDGSALASRTDRWPFDVSLPRLLTDLLPLPRSRIAVEKRREELAHMEAVEHRRRTKVERLASVKVRRDGLACSPDCAL